VWIWGARAGGAPRRLTATAGDVVDRDPCWAPGARQLVFASNRADAAGTTAGTSFDLWRLDLTAGEGGGLAAAGPPARLTETPGHELHPSVSPDGGVVYALVDVAGAVSELWRGALDGGAPTQLTEGPFDVTPSWSPDGKTIAFAAPQTSNPKAIKDADLFQVDADGGGRRLLLEEMGDETGPVWSPDGRYLFATSVYRSVDTGKPVLSSVIFIDLQDGKPDGEHVVRALHDSAGPVQRASPAVAPSALAEAELAANKPYGEAVNDAVRHYLLRRADELESEGLLPDR
jgi:Tol biopolymer transport system component